MQDGVLPLIMHVTSKISPYHLVVAIYRNIIYNEHCDHEVEVSFGFRDQYKKEEVMMLEVNLAIDGMSCQHCVMRVKKALDQMPGVSGSEVNVRSAKVTYDESKVKKEDVEKVVENAGYTIRR